MAEVDWAEWAIEAADGFRETKWQNIGVALRQLAHELIDTRARLTTAETERDQAMWDKQDHWNARLAAEARVEAAERERDEWKARASGEFDALIQREYDRQVGFVALAERVVEAYTNEAEDRNDGEFALWQSEGLVNAIVALRAALACPPTEEEK